jgi:hypothetical protein
MTERGSSTLQEESDNLAGHGASGQKLCRHVEVKTLNPPSASRRASAGGVVVVVGVVWYPRTACRCHHLLTPQTLALCGISNCGATYVAGSILVKYSLPGTYICCPDCFSSGGHHIMLQLLHE